jgi:hypothetical protein
MFTSKLNDFHFYLFSRKITQAKHFFCISKTNINIAVYAHFKLKVMLFNTLGKKFE